ncbi:uncharacterized protein, partial [Battus philenor]|uniref:uncharacterized protein n=1 Tax=Battus philenor TaxID=42288 RepID=UPI0035D0849A
SPSPSSSSAHPSPSGNFAGCTARFNGASRDSDILEAFIDAIVIYKECINIADDHALRGLPMLLEGEAAVWFRGVKSSVASWEDAMQRLRAMYGAPRPPHKIFRDIFASEQGDREQSEVFIGRLRASIAKLPYALDERIHLDMIYGLLNKRIRKRLTRESVQSVDELVSKARYIEDSLMEVSSVAQSRAPSNQQAGSAGSRSRATCNAAAAAAVPAVVSAANAPNRGKRFCVYCKKSGHDRDECSRLNSKSDPHTVSDSFFSSDFMSTNRHLYSKTEQCQAHVSFDCNTVFLNSVCNVYDVPDARSVDNSRTERLRPDVCTKGRPILDIEMFGYRGTGLLDTAAKRSVAGSTLYSLLLKLGQPMRSSVMTVKLADGVVRDVTVRLVDVVVMLAGASIPITFIIFPDAVNNETLLGIDFIRKAGLVIDIFNETWFTADQPQVIHPLR